MEEQIEYEPEKEPEWCCYCEYFEYDSWYHGERVCANNYGPQCGESVDKYDHCEWFERRQE